MQELVKGTLLQGGKYKIEKKLGQGGFGITYLASQTISIEGPIGQIETEIKLAIKEFFMKDVCNRNEDSNIVSVPSVGSKELVERFKQKFVKEAWNISKLNHSHIVKVVDVFEENGTAYYVMEYHNGGSLSDLVKDGNPLPEADAVRYITQIADAVGYIHKQKINHLDIKPGNILLDGKANGILIDFGLSKQYDEKGSQTSSTPVGISHGYAPMEQYNPGGVSTFSPQSDIYSLGATLYKLVTGTTPPQANEIFNDGLPALPAYLSDGVKKAIEQAMQPRKKERPATAEEFIALLSSDAAVVVPAVAPANNEATKIIAQPSEETLVEEPVEKPIEKPTPEPVKPAAPEKKEPETKNEEPTKENEVKEESNVWKWVLAAIIVGIFVCFCWGGGFENFGGNDTQFLSNAFDEIARLEGFVAKEPKGYSAKGYSTKEGEGKAIVHGNSEHRDKVLEILSKVPNELLKIDHWDDRQKIDRFYLEKVNNGNAFMMQIRIGRGGNDLYAQLFTGCTYDYYEQLIEEIRKEFENY